MISETEAYARADLCRANELLQAAEKSQRPLSRRLLQLMAERIAQAAVARLTEKPVAHVT